jgi:hypothetical protein
MENLQTEVIHCDICNIDKEKWDKHLKTKKHKRNVIKLKRLNKP